MIAMTGAALLLPAPWALLLLGGLFLVGRPIVWFTISTLAINSVLLGLLVGEPDWWTWSNDGAWRGFVGGARISAVLIWNGVALRNAGYGWFLDALHLPTKASVYVGAIWLSMAGLKQDFSNIKENLELQGAWPASRHGQVRLATQLLPTMLFRAHERANIRKDALQLIGITTPTWFAPFVALTALASAGRIAFIAIPNVALTYVLVFAGGLLYGPRVAMLAAAASMAGTNLILSGFAPQSFVNVPAMMAIGLLGGMLRSLDFRSTSGRMVAAATGFFATLGFSVVADTLAWALIPEFRGSLALLQVRVLAGLAFNVVPAVVNGALFAAVSGACQETQQE